MPEEYWLTIKIRASDSEHRISHGQPVRLKVNFDENPQPDKTGSSKRFVAEYSSLGFLDPQGNQQCDFQLTEAEFNSDNFRLHIWGEPYGYVALQRPDAHGGLYVGRLRLTPQHCHKGTLIHQPVMHYCRQGKQIFCEIGIGASVVDYMVEEFNNNLHSDQFKQVKRQLDRAQEEYWRAGIKRDSKKGADNAALMRLNSHYMARSGGVIIDYLPDANIGDLYSGYAAHDYACLVHSRGLSSEDWIGKIKEWGQDFVVCNVAKRFRNEGGMWDHKPHIYRIWGTDNRLGNHELAYYYDIWSNMHYGFIGIKAGFSQEHLLEGANQAQIFDNEGATEDDPVDREAMLEGMRLAGIRESISMADLMSIIVRKPHWDADTRRNKND